MSSLPCKFVIVIGNHESSPPFSPSFFSSPFFVFLPPWVPSVTFQGHGIFTLLSILISLPGSQIDNVHKSPFPPPSFFSPLLVVSWICHFTALNSLPGGSLNHSRQSASSWGCVNTYHMYTHSPPLFPPPLPSPLFFSIILTNPKSCRLCSQWAPLGTGHRSRNSGQSKHFFFVFSFLFPLSLFALELPQQKHQPWSFCRWL